MAAFTMSEAEETCVRVAAGERFALRFRTSPGTGFSWRFAAEPDPRLLRFVEEKTEESKSGLLGAPETAVWIFEALAAGRAAIALEYVRPWETEAEPARKHVFRVTIE